MNAIWTSLVVVSVLFFLTVMAQAPIAGRFVLGASAILFWRNLWAGLTALFNVAALYDHYKRDPNLNKTP